MKQISKKLADSILEETDAEAMIVVTFANKIVGNPFSVKGFQISGINVDKGNIPLLFIVLNQILNGNMQMEIKGSREEIRKIVEEDKKDNEQLN